MAAPIFKELSDKIYASDISLHKPINNNKSFSTLPKVKQGRTTDANLILEELNIPFKKNCWRMDGFSNNRYRS